MKSNKIYVVISYPGVPNHQVICPQSRAGELLDLIGEELDLLHPTSADGPPEPPAIREEKLKKNYQAIREFMGAYCLQLNEHLCFSSPTGDRVVLPITANYDE